MKPQVPSDDHLRANASAQYAVDCLAVYQWMLLDRQHASRALANHVAYRPSCERTAYDALNVPKGDGKLPTQTWLMANLDLHPAFADWRQTRNALEAEVQTAQDEVEVARLKAELAVKLVLP